jgi:hypothetical protein
MDAAPEALGLNELVALRVLGGGRGGWPNAGTEAARRAQGLVALHAPRLVASGHLVHASRWSGYALTRKGRAALAPQ